MVLADGDTVSSLDGLREITLWLGEPIDPDTVADGAILVTGAAGGEMASRVSGLRLDGGGRKLTAEFAEGLPDGDRYTFAASDVVRTAGGEAVDASITLALLAGDVDGSGEVTVADLLAVRQAVGRPVGSRQAALDPNCSGNVTASDMLAVRSRLGRQLAEPKPPSEP